MIGQAERLYEIQNLFKRNPAAASNNIFTFSSGKGGTGKTFLALNTALALSSLKKRVLLVDLDLNLANIHLLMDIIPHKTINDFLEKKDSLQNIVIKSSDNLSIIFGDSGKKEWSGDAYNYLLKNIIEISSLYDFVLIDTGAGVSDKTADAVKAGKYNLIVTTPEATSVMDAYVLIKKLSAKDYCGKNGCIINKCFSEEEAETTFNNLNSAVKHFLKMDVEFLGSIPYEPEIIRSIRDQNPFYKNDVRAPAGRAILTISKKISEAGSAGLRKGVL